MVEMDQSRAERAAAAMKNIETLGKEIRKPSALKSATVKGPTKLSPTGIPEPIAGSGFLQVIMYIIAGILGIGLILMAVDQWITPIFQRAPGAAGFILIPGSDTSEVYWENPREVVDITIGVPPDANPNAPSPNAITAVYSNLIQDALSYSITMDVVIEDEFPQNLGSDPLAPTRHRRFFMIGKTTSSPILSFELENNTNTVRINSHDADGMLQTAIIDNVPIHVPFRVGVVKTPNVLEAYLDGLLVKTIRLRSTTINPASGDIIYSTGSITHGVDPNKVMLSRGIKAMNLRLFGGAISPAEMKARMNNLLSVGNFSLALGASPGITDANSTFLSAFSTYLGL